MIDELEKQEFSSFRDPSGFLFYRDQELYRQVNQSYKPHYQFAIDSGLYDFLHQKNWLIYHEETDEPGLSTGSHRVIKPEQIPFVSYPYEWCFSQLKDAALLTLRIQHEALAKGMTLKDASVYNIQFHHGKAVFIDTLSFEIYEDGSPWLAYRQFCQHFLAPLALMSLVDVRLNKLFINYIDGIPLELASKLLPLRSRFSLLLGLHLHLHARQLKKSQGAEAASDNSNIKISLKSQLALLDSLYSGIKKLKWSDNNTEWHDYYASNNNYENDSLSVKENLVAAFLEGINAQEIWDLGANDGRFSRIASQYSRRVISWDIDPACVENNYRSCRKDKQKSILPLLIDLTNPSPAIGWDNSERQSFTDRGPCDALLALGLIHHLVIANNLPLDYVARAFSQLARDLVIEFVPKEDSQVVKLLSSRVDIFDDYTEDFFESVFSRYYSLEKKQLIEGTVRTLYLFRYKENN